VSETRVSPFETVAFHEYPVVGLSARVTSTRSLAGMVRISPFDVLFTGIVVAELPERVGVSVMLWVWGGVVETGVPAGTVAAGVMAGDTVGTEVDADGDVISVHPAKRRAATTRVQHSAPQTRDILILVTW
jgi:hypothetical protein